MARGLVQFCLRPQIVAESGFDGSCSAGGSGPVPGRVFYWSLSPLPDQGGEREVTIAYASSARAVANQLQAQGIIRNADGFFGI